MATTLWIQTQHEVVPTTSIQITNLLPSSAIDITERARATIVAIRGTYTATSIRTAAGVGTFELYTSLVVADDQMDAVDFLTNDDIRSNPDAAMWKTYDYAKLSGDGTNALTAYVRNEMLDVRSKRKLSRRGTLFAITEGVNVASQTPVAQLRLGVLLAFPR